MDPSADPNSSEFDLKGLYKQLSGIATIEQRVKEHQAKSLNISVRRRAPHNPTDDPYEPLWVVAHHELSYVSDVQRRQRETNSLLLTLLQELRKTVRMNVNAYLKMDHTPLPGILDMPNEILTEIFKYVKDCDHFPGSCFKLKGFNSKTREHVGDVRLTCKRFCATSSHLLLHNVRLEGIDQKSISHLDKISSHPLISRGVASIQLTLGFYAADLAHDIYKFTEYNVNKLSKDELGSSSSLSQPKSSLDSLEQCSHVLVDARKRLESWKVFLEGTPEDPVDSKTSFRARLQRLIANDTSESGHFLILQKAHGQYKHLFSEQRHLFNRRRFIDAVASAFARMPMARKLELLDPDDEYMRLVHWSKWAERDTDLIRCFCKPMRAREARIFGIQQPVRMLRMPITIPIAIHKAGTWLDSFVVQLSYPGSHSCLALTVDEKAAMRAAMGRLASFVYESRPVHERDKFEMRYLKRYFGAVLDTESLRRISIELGEYWDADARTPSYDMGILLCFRSWPKLELLSLSCIPFRLTHYQRFLEKSQNRFTFSLTNAYLLKGTWREVLDAAHEARKKYRSDIYWKLDDPCGAECVTLSEERMACIFERLDEDESSSEHHSYAERYMHGDLETNPFDTRST